MTYHCGKCGKEITEWDEMYLCNEKIQCAECYEGYEHKKWGIVGVTKENELIDDEIHIIPVGDKKPHRLSADCECEPKTEKENGVLMTTHNAYDFRDVMEWLEQEKL